MATESYFRRCEGKGVGVGGCGEGVSEKEMLETVYWNLDMGCEGLEVVWNGLLESGYGM